jgi:hypothetical protein
VLYILGIPLEETSPCRNLILRSTSQIAHSLGCVEGCVEECVMETCAEWLKPLVPELSVEWVCFEKTAVEALVGRAVPASRMSSGWVPSGTASGARSLPGIYSTFALHSGRPPAMEYGRR